MTKTESVPPEFWDRADEVIAVANKQLEKETSGKVSSSILYAASRFNAFQVAEKCKTAEEMKENIEDATSYYVDQYKKNVERKSN